MNIIPLKTLLIFLAKLKSKVVKHEFLERNNSSFYIIRVNILIGCPPDYVLMKTNQSDISRPPYSALNPIILHYCYLQITHHCFNVQAKSHKKRSKCGHYERINCYSARLSGPIEIKSEICLPTNP